MDEDFVRQLAKQYFLFDVSLSLPTLIRRIQLAEGESDCYATKTECDRLMCLWRENCLAEFAE